ncbi:glycosyltransferase family 2 protein [Serratia sp. S4]|uniref:glycosyltransferase family 2 protein n=1 Tax=Serratia sp. S4 TaxID=768491 RepID=UPI0003A0E4B9|nr:glycosyltransferase family 2 protein [Serratia sp. S4]
MMVLIVGFVFISVCTLLIINIRQYSNIKKSREFIADESRNLLLAKKTNRIVILIPVMDECSVIDGTTKYFKQILASYPKSMLVFVTTQKEGDRNKNKTYKKIQPYLSEEVLIIHYPFTTGNKASQINYAVRRLNSMLNTDDIETYYGVFDADSRPDPRGLNYVSQDVHREEIYQMPPVYSTNFNELSLLGKASAIFQTRWMMSHELPALLKNYRKQKPILLSYCIGHGLFIRRQYLENNPFPTETVTEDLLFGYKAVLGKVYVKPLPYFDYCSSVPRLAIAVRQSARWHAGDLSSIMILMRSRSKVKNKKRFLLLGKRVFQMLQWPFGPILTILAIGISFSFEWWPAVVLMLVLTYWYVVLLHKPILDVFFKANASSSSIYIALLIKSFINCVGAVYSYFLMANPKVDLWFKTPRE